MKPICPIANSLSRFAAGKTVVLLSLLCLPALSANAAPGDLDPTFGTGGWVTTDIGTGFGFPNSRDSVGGVAVQAESASRKVTAG